MPLPDPALNRSFHYGDGFFETIRLGISGFCPLIGFHADRISRSAGALGMNSFIGMDELRLRKLIALLPFEVMDKDLKLKLIFFRHGFSGSYSPAESGSCFLSVFSETLDLPFFSTIHKVLVSEQVQIFPEFQGWVKSTSALRYVLAAQERQKKNADEIILCSPDGFVVEGGFTSLCWKDAGGLHFTDRSLGGIDSCQRRLAEKHFGSSAINFSEARISAIQLLQSAHWIAFMSALGVRMYYPGGAKPEIPPEFSNYPVSFYRGSRF